MALGFFDRKAGLAQFTEERIADPAVRKLAAKIRYVVDPDDQYPNNFTGKLVATLADGSVCEFQQPHMRGGRHAPLTEQEIEDKFRDNARYGGWDASTAEAFLSYSREIFQARDLGRLAEFRK
jgi:2-methylcitrate dehydratase PrpD